MRNIAKVGLTAAAAALAVTVPVGTAAATNEVTCTSSEFLQINSARGSFCFANGGDALTDYQIDQVKSVSTGNNAVQLRDVNGKRYSFLKHAKVKLPNVTIVYIKIV